MYPTCVGVAVQGGGEQAGGERLQQVGAEPIGQGHHCVLQGGNMVMI